MKKEDAVSEVVGIMILLTITVVLAAVVALAATSMVGETEKPLSAEITAVSVTGDGHIIFELISGEPFTLSDIRVVLGVREDSSKSVSIPGTELEAKTGDTIFLGDRFYLDGTSTADEISFGEMKVSHGEHLTYRFYDSTDRPFSSGEIRI